MADEPLNGFEWVGVNKWGGDKRGTRMLFYIKRCSTVCEGFVNAVWTLWMLEWCNLSHLKALKIKGKLAVCEGVNTFFGMKNTYRYVRRGGWVGMVGMIRELFFTIRRFVLSTQGLEKTTQGLEISSPGLEITSHRVGWTSRRVGWTSHRVG